MVVESTHWLKLPTMSFSLQGRMVQASGANETAVAGTVFLCNCWKRH